MAAIVRFLPISPNWPTVRCVPFSAPYDANLSVPFSENRPSNSMNQRPRYAQSGSCYRFLHYLNKLPIGFTHFARILQTIFNLVEL